jgi:hypothetical protein
MSRRRSKGDLGWLAKGVESHCGEARNVGVRFWRAVIICCCGQYVASVDGRQEIKRGAYGIRSVDAGEKVVGGKEAVVLWSETADHVILG